MATVIAKNIPEHVWFVVDQNNVRVAKVISVGVEPLSPVEAHITLNLTAAVMAGKAQLVANKLSLVEREETE